MRYAIFLMTAAVVLFSCAGSGAKGSAAANSAASTDSVSGQRVVPVNYTYRVVRVLPHDPLSYTQGLYFDNGHFMEGTGQWGLSALKRVEVESGKVLENKPLADEFFGEGIARVGNKIYQLTWTDGKAFVYDAVTLRHVGEFSYTGEGWGLATDGSKLYMSDGSNRIFVVDPTTFERERVIDVKAGGSRVNMLNEMEWIEGELWANVYMSDLIVRIDPLSGNVTGIVDLEGLLPTSDRTPQTDVLNGIAYDASMKRVFVTGKNWSKLFEIELIEKEK